MPWYNILQEPSDVDKTPPVNGDILIYDDSINLWKPGQISIVGNSLYLKLDQSTIQHIINGTPQFDEGITVSKDKFIFLDG